MLGGHLAAPAGVEARLAGGAHVGAGGQRLRDRRGGDRHLGAALAAVGVQLSLRSRWDGIYKGGPGWQKRAILHMRAPMGPKQRKCVETT